MSVSVTPSPDTHWWLKVAFCSPSASAIPDVSALSVWPTRAVPVMAGLPVAGVLAAVCSWLVAGPLTNTAAPISSFFSEPVQTAPASPQLAVIGSSRVTSSLPSGWTVISQRRLEPWVVRLTLATSPLVTSRTWSLTASKPRTGSSLKWISKVKALEPSCSLGSVALSKAPLRGWAAGRGPRRW